MRSLIYLGLVLAAASPAAAQTASVNNSPAIATSFAPNTSLDPVDLAGRKWHRSVVELREAALRLKAADGGTLSAEHRALLQQRLDGVNRRYASYAVPPCGGTRIDCDEGS